MAGSRQVRAANCSAALIDHKLVMGDTCAKEFAKILSLMVDYFILMHKCIYSVWVELNQLGEEIV